MNGYISYKYRNLAYYQNGLQSIPSNTYTPITFNTVDPSYNINSSDVGITASVNNSVFTNTSGSTRLFFVSASIIYATNINANRYIWINMNSAAGSQRLGLVISQGVALDNTLLSTSSIVMLNNNESFSIGGYQSYSTSAINTGSSVSSYPTALMNRIQITAL